MQLGRMLFKFVTNGKCPGKKLTLLISYGRVLNMEHFYQDDAVYLELLMINSLGTNLLMRHDSLEKDTKTSN